MTAIFRQVPVRKPRRNVFRMPHEVKLTTEFARLTPVFCEPVVPGDTWSVNTSMYMRLAPLIAPVMHRCNWYVHFFFVPNRLVWTHWEEFITGGEDGTEAPEYPTIIPPLDFTKNSSLVDYLGFPPVTSGNDMPEYDALPIRAYNLIWNEYYRDQNLTEEVDIMADSDGKLVGTNDNIVPVRNLMLLKNRCWEKDYFTSALPWTQRGPEVRLPLSGDAPVTGTVSGSTYGFTTGSVLRDSSDHSEATGNNNVAVSDIGTNSGRLRYVDDSGTYHDMYVHKSEGIDIEEATTEIHGSADMSNVSAATINELRRCIALQRWMEANARGGSRYIEQIWSHFGVRSSDARLQRPEFLGGGKGTIMFENIPQTSSSDSESPQGNYAGNGSAGGSTHNFRKFFEEYGFIIGILSVMPKPSYQQGMPRKYLKRDRFDFYFPEFANLGEQEIQQQELYYQPNDSSGENEKLFGYTPRYAEYKYIPSSVHGAFRDSLDFWHLGRIFDDAPLLNTDFVTCNPEDVDRIWAVESDPDHPDTDHLWIQMLVDAKAIRPMPKFGVPLI